MLARRRLSALLVGLPALAAACLIGFASNPPAWAQDANPPFQLMWGFPDIPPRGPQHAQGMILWSSVAADDPAKQPPPPLVIRHLVAKGWDVLTLARNPTLDRASRSQQHVADLVNQIAASQQLGYSHIMVAGQGYNGSVAMGAAGQVPVFGLIAMAPGYGTPDLIAQSTYTQVNAAKASRALYVLPADDEAMGGIDRSPQVRQELDARRVPYILVDRQVHGNSGGYTKEFFPFAGCASWFFLPGLAVRPGEYNCYADPLMVVAASMGLIPQGATLAWLGYLDDSGQPVVVIEHRGKTGSTIDYGVGGGNFGADKASGAHGIPAQWNGNVLSFAFGQGAAALTSQSDSKLWRLTITDGTQKHWNWSATMGMAGGQ